MPTIQDLFLRGKSLLGEFPQPFLEAKILLMSACRIPEEKIYSSPELKVSRAQERRFFQMIARRLAGFPIAYLTGRREFWSISFKIQPGVIIPRPETELLVEKVLECSSGEGEIIVDIGTGCGNIAVALARELPQAQFIATDISQKALKVARINASEQKVQNISFRMGNLFTPLAKLGLKGGCNCIVSNPPYVSEEEWTRLPVPIRNHEPKNGLVAGKTGLEVMEKIIRNAPKWLKPGGRLFLEIGQGQRDAVVSLLGSRWEAVNSHDDLNGIPRVITATII